VNKLSRHFVKFAISIKNTGSSKNTVQPIIRYSLHVIFWGQKGPSWSAVSSDLTPCGNMCVALNFFTHERMHCYILIV